MSDKIRHPGNGKGEEQHAKGVEKQAYHADLPGLGGFADWGEEGGSAGADIGT